MYEAFLVLMPSGTRYWTVVDDGLEVVEEADAARAVVAISGAFEASGLLTEPTETFAQVSQASVTRFGPASAW